MKIIQENNIIKKENEGLKNTINELNEKIN